LERAENDGAVNLTMAHVFERENRNEEAKAYFHRAVFGRWGADSLARRRQSRFELIDLLSRLGASRELLAELLPFEETPVDSVALRDRLGHLFILAGSPARAANMFREVLRRDPGDADAYAGMGEAALALGNFRTARADLAEAARLHPDDAQIARRLAVADTVLALDPTARTISSQERYARSRALLVRTLSVIEACQQPRGALADSAQGMLARAPIARGPEALGETMMSQAVDVWAARPASCTAVKNDDALRLVHDRLAP
jgi:tetratricopeptide (TPR) repeat protein